MDDHTAVMTSRGSCKVTKTTRYAYIDLLRCLAVLLVIMLHCVSGYANNTALFGTRTWWACNIINSFARMGVPLFFMISGFLLLSSEGTCRIGAFYKRRFSKLCIPFLFWDVIYYFEVCVLEGRTPTLLSFLNELTRQGSKYHLWFIYQILALYLLMPFLKKIVDHSTERERWAFLLVILLQPTLFRFINIIQRVVYIAPFLALVEGYAGFILTGYLLGICPKMTRRQRTVAGAAGCVGLAGGSLGNFLFSSPEKIAMYFSEGYSIAQYITAGALFLLAKELAERLPERLLRWTKSLSGLTFGMYFVHVLFLDFYYGVLPRLGLDFPPSLDVVLSFLFASAASICVVYIFSKLPLLRRLI